MNNILENVGHKIKKLREFKDLSQGYIAQELGVSQAQYSRLEKGESKLKEEQLEKIAKILKTTVKEIQDFEFYGDKLPTFNHSGSGDACSFNKNVNYYQIDPSLDKLYKEHIALLKEALKTKDEAIEDLKKENEKLRMKDK